MKTLLLVLLMLSIAFAGDTLVAGHNIVYSPANISSVTLGPCNGTVWDSIEASSSNVYGPYRLSKDMKHSMYSSMKWYTHDSSLISATDSVTLSYQIIDGKTINDTAALWNMMDTLVGVSADTGGVVDISSCIGTSIFFRLKNLQTADTAVVYNPIRVNFKYDLESRLLE